MIRFLVLLLFATAAFAGKPHCDAFGWCKQPNVGGWVQGSYTPVAVVPGGIIVMGNSLFYGDWSEQTGTWTKLNTSFIAVPSEAVYDEPCGVNGYCVRTSAVQHLSTGGCVGMLTVGNGYPSTDSFRPSWVTSDDCKRWLYYGHLLIDGSEQGYGQTDTQAMVVNEAAPEVPDHVAFGNNRYLVYENYQDRLSNGHALGLILVYSADGVTWFRATDAFGNWLDVLPPGIVPLGMPNFAFPTAARTPYGVHIIAADTYPATRLIHLFACDGVNFRVLEANSGVYTSSVKGTNLTYDPATNLLHAYSNGTHYTLAERDWGC